MFSRLEFSDINRYLVSTGTILFALAFLLPYFYLKENFGVIISESEYEKYTEISRKIIDNKQNNVLWFQDSIFFISSIVLISGCLLVFIGIWRWKKRQSKIDQKFDKELEKLEIEIKQLTPEEKEEKIQEEIKIATQSDRDDKKSTYTPDYQTFRTIYNKVESIISIKVITSQYIKSTYKVYTEIKVNKKYIDILLRNSKRDIVIEVKYLNIGHPNTIKNLCNNLDYTLGFYKKDLIKEVVGKMIIVYNDGLEGGMTGKMNYTWDTLNKIDVYLLKYSDLETFEIDTIVID